MSGDLTAHNAELASIRKLYSEMCYLESELRDELDRIRAEGKALADAWADNPWGGQPYIRELSNLLRIESTE